MTAKDLKNALLQEAVQGKLVPQIASEGNARDLLEEIRKEKLSHGLDFANAKSGKKKSKKETALAGSNPCDIIEEEIPFDIPENWCWCRLGEIVKKITDGTHNSPTNTPYGEYKYITAKNIKETGIDLSNITYVSKDVHDEIFLRCNPELNDVLLIKDGATTGVVTVNNLSEPFSMLSSVALIKLPEEINPWFLTFVLRSDLFYKNLRSQMKGTGITRITLKQIEPTLIPLPPLAEQKRIVAAIEKFMPLIEEYGKKETELKALNEQIGTLTKKAILQEAVQGTLVPQIAAEGNARDLLEEIRKERLSHGFANSYGICDGKNKKSKSSDLRSKSQIRVTKKELPEITEDEIPFDIPENWCWCRLGDISTFNGGYAFKSENYVTKENGVRVLRISDFDENGIKDKNPVYYPYNSELENYKLSINDIIMCMTGGTVGKSFLVKDLNEEMYVNQRVADIKCNKLVDIDYIYSVILSHHVQLSIQDNKNSTNDNISADLIKKFLIPLPPLAEQKRIVAAIEKMLPLCEKLGE